MQIVSFIIPFFLLVLGSKKERSKPVMIIICIYMWVMYSFNTYNGDFESYYLIYGAMSQGKYLWHFEPAFSLIMRISTIIGLDYFGFKAIIGFIYISLVYCLFAKYSEAPALALALFFIFPFIYNISVVRGGISGIIVCYAFCKYTEGGQRARINYLLWVLLATLFHYSAIFFAFLFFVERIEKPKKVFLFSAVFSLIMMGLVYSGAAYSILSAFTARIKSLQWLSSALYAHLNIKGILLVIFIFIANYLLSTRCYGIVSRDALFDEKQIKLFRMARAANCALFIVLPFAIMSDVLLRYVFEFMGVNIATYSTTVYFAEKKCDDLWSVPLIKLVVFVWVFFLLIYSTLPYLGTDISAFNSFYNNLLFGQKVPF